MVRKIKAVKRSIMIVLILGYLAATIVKSDFWGNILSPIITIETFYVIYKAFYSQRTKELKRLPGLLLSLSILFWAIGDVLWAIYDTFLHIDPEKVDIITYSYSMTNLFLVLSLSFYGIQMFRRWNVVQFLLDSVVMSYFIIQLLWIVFLNQSVKNIMELRSDWVSSVSIILDVLVIMWIVIWYMSVRNGKIPMFLRFLASGVFLFTIVDLIYYYEYLYRDYDPNTLLDAAYIASFRLIAVAAALRIKYKELLNNNLMYNTGRKGKGHFLFIAPAILIIFKGVVVTELLQFVIVILLYYMFSYYIQKSIYKEGLLRKEQELNTVLEQKVKERTEELTEKNKLLQNLLDQDTVTSLFNRRYLLSYLEKIADNLKFNETIILLYIDINRFKMITTMFGHYIGDKILYEMAEKLKPLRELEKECILASYGDDAYIFATIGNYNYEHGYELAQEAIRLCSNIYRVDEYQIRVTVNIGISVYNSDSKNMEELIKHADIAMTQARMQGFNVVKEFDAKLSEVIFRKNSIEIMLKQVNFNKEFMVYYQPQLLTESKKIIGFEALLRWKTPSGEFIGPNEFIPVAEETGYIIPIGDWVIKMVLKQIADWNNSFQEKIMVGINISLKQLNSDQFIEKFKVDMARLEIKPEWVDLEITESLHLQENPDIFQMLEDIRKLGVTISIDDFGTGYSSLSYFKGLPADRIKLAKELIDFIHVDEFDYQLVKSIILLSKAKGIRVIAEGVETEEQWEALKELECDEVQGYLFGRPLPVSEIDTVFGEELRSGILL